MDNLQISGPDKQSESGNTDFIQISGQIYYIENTITKKGYVGQTLSHRKNKNKYKPFGFDGRFKDHISEAICNTKKKQCRYLNNAIRQYGKDAFSVNLLHECSKDELDTKEKEYIEKMNTLYPNGYNLTNGGKGARYIKTEDVEPLQLQKASKRGGCKERSQETRAKIAASNKDTFSSENVKKDLMKRTQAQHYQNKVKKFKDIKIDKNNTDQYIYERKNSIVIKINNIRTDFVGKYETKETLRERAREFLKNVATLAMLPNCSGKP